MQQVILLGDSIRLGYQTEVKKNLEGKASTWGPKENCQDSAFIIKNLDKWLKDKKPDLIYLNCGLHDVFLGQNGKCRRSDEAYGKNIDTIFKKLRTIYPKLPIVFALTTPVDEEKQKSSKIYGRLVRRNSDITVYNAKAAELAKKYNIRTDDLNSLVVASDVKTMLISGGIHLNSKAKKILGQHIANKILLSMK